MRETNLKVSDLEIVSVAKLIFSLQNNKGRNDGGGGGKF